MAALDEARQCSRGLRVICAVAALTPLLATDVFASVAFSEPAGLIEVPPSAIRLTISPDGNRQLYGEPRKVERLSIFGPPARL